MTAEESRKRNVPYEKWFAVEDADLPELSDPLFRVWIELNMIFARNRYGRFQVSDRRLSEICNVHSDTIKRRVIKLAEFRLISMERKQGKIPLYRILPLSEFKEFQKWRQKFREPKKKKKTPLEEKGLPATACRMSSSNSLQDVTYGTGLQDVGVRPRLPNARLLK